MILKLGFYLLLCNQLPFLHLELIGLFYFRQYNNNLSDEKNWGEKKSFFWKDSLSESTDIAKWIFKEYVKPILVRITLCFTKIKYSHISVCQSLLHKSKADFHKEVTPQTQLKLILHFILKAGKFCRIMWFNATTMKVVVFSGYYGSFYDK